MKTSARIQLQVNGVIDIGGKRSRGVIGRVHQPNPTAAEIRKEIFSRKAGRILVNRWIVETTTGDCASTSVAYSVSVNEEWLTVGWVRWRTVTLANVPAIVRTGNAIVNLLKRDFSDVVDEESAGARLKRKRKRISKSDCPDRAIISSGRP